MSVVLSPRDRPTGQAFRLYAAVVVCAAVVAGGVLGWQGWNSRIVNFDYINFIDGAHRFLKDGVWPDRGDVSSYWAYAPPGASLLMVPGMLMFDDPRLYESVAAVALYAGTVLGLFLLARQCFGLTCACLSVVVYALSRNGMFNAGSIYPIGHPFFFVWMAYCCLRWVQRNDGRYLAAALTMWGVGMYVDMVIAPALFMIPAIWLLYRPRIAVMPLALAALVVAAVWFPYLHFEQTREFADLKSLVSRQSLRITDYARYWCNPSLVVQRVGEPIRAAESRPPVPLDAEGGRTVERPSGTAAAAAWIRLRSATVRDGMAFNFDQMTWTPRFAAPLFLLSLATLAFIGFDTASKRRPPENWRVLTWLKPIGWGLVGLSLLINEVLITRYLGATGTLSGATTAAIRLLQGVLAVSGFALAIGHRPIAAWIRRTGMQLRAHREDERRQFDDVLAVALIVPWLALVMVVEQEAANRYLWLWPLQMVFVVAAVTYVPQRLRWPKSAARSAQVLLALLLLTHPWLRAPIEAWAAEGWSGVKSENLQALDFIAEQLRSEGRTGTAVGYNTLMASFMAREYAADTRYKIGGELDLYLQQRHGIDNSTHCAEGISPDDEYRIVQNRPSRVVSTSRPTSWLPLGGELKGYAPVFEYFDVPLDPDFRLTRSFGDFHVFRRSRPTTVAAATNR